MDMLNGHPVQQQRALSVDLQWFFAKSKVSISLAITEFYPFLRQLKEAGILSEEESLELKADMRSVPRGVYECLCRVEEKHFPLLLFFEHLFQKPYIKKYPDLKPIYKEYRHERYRNRDQVTADIDKDRIIFAQDKVKICFAITDLFPFVHGLQDLTLLSELESLKLQADGRPVSRVIYECLSLIEKKDMKLSVVFEYIFQECYLKLYPSLQKILQEPCEEQADVLNAWKKRPNYMLNLFQSSKTAICRSITERFPFLYGLHDIGLLSRMQLLKLQGDQRPTKDVLYKALCLIEQSNDMEALCAYVFGDFYLNLFPNLRAVLQKLIEALKLEKAPPPAELLLTPGYKKTPVAENIKVKRVPEEHRTADFSKPLSKKLGPAAKRVMHEPPSVKGPPEKRPLKAGPAESQMKIKIYSCDYNGCQRAFSDISRFTKHRRKHTGKEKVSI